jgi:predicted PurR-regulated permease PerM
LGGVVGLFIAVPVAAIISVVYRHWLEGAHQLRQVQHLRLSPAVPTGLETEST